MGAGKKTAGEQKSGRSGDIADNRNESQNGFLSLSKYQSGKYLDLGICLVIFFSALFLIIAFSNPGLYLTDEWITVNQVHQLDIGHQITINEGKYGVYKNGTPSPYFADRKNILMYSLALPLASLPLLKLGALFGDHFRLAIIALWAFLPFLSALVISTCFPARARIGNIRITVITAVIGFLLLAANLLVYSPFIYFATDAPVEVAAVVFTNHLFFALTMVMIYLIARTIFDGRWKAIFTMLAGGACSAYLFWGANAKDHMATAAVFSIVLFCFVRYIRTQKLLDAAFGFLFIGILAWIRPEVGFSVFLCISIFIIADNLLRIYRKERSLMSGILHSCTLIFTAVGAIPFFLNNLIVSGNPLSPSYMIEEKANNSGELLQIIPVNHAVNVSQSVTGNPLAIGNDLIATIAKYVFTVSPNPLQDCYGILFFPSSGSLGMFFVSPLALLALLLIPIIILGIRLQNDGLNDKREFLLFLMVAAFSVLLAYLHDLSGLNSSLGIGPDIRYLSPLYLPVVLMSLVLLEKTILFVHPKVLVLRSCVLGIVIVPLFLVALILINPGIWNSSTSNYRAMFNILILAEVILTVVVVAWYHFAGRKPDGISDLLLPILIVTVLAWQVLMIFLISPVTKFNAYPFWIPGIDALYHYFITVTVVPL